VTGQPYQRGNRDGLLNLAAELEVLADTAKARVDALRRRVNYRLTAGPSADHWEVEARAYTRAASLARRRAEACPEDPEVGE
jgi:hypothetical protein